MIRAANLTRRFGSITALDHLDLEVGRGESFCLVGPDGAGKTTTLRLMCGLLDATEGEAWVAEHSVAHEPDAVKDRIGYMAQRFGLYADLTIDENMAFYGDLFGVVGAERDWLVDRHPLCRGRDLLRTWRGAWIPLRCRWRGRWNYLFCWLSVVYERSVPTILGGGKRRP